MMPFLIILSVTLGMMFGFIKPASANVFAVSGDTAPQFRSFLIIAFLLMSGSGGTKIILLTSVKVFSWVDLSVRLQKC